MYDEIVKNINERISVQPNSMCATGDEVRICWLVAEVERLREIINKERSQPTVSANGADAAICEECPDETKGVLCYVCGGNRHERTGK